MTLTASQAINALTVTNGGLARRLRPTDGTKATLLPRLLHGNYFSDRGAIMSPCRRQSATKRLSGRRASMSLFREQSDCLLRRASTALRRPQRCFRFVVTTSCPAAPSMPRPSSCHSPTPVRGLFLRPRLIILRACASKGAERHGWMGRCVGGANELRADFLKAVVVAVTSLFAAMSHVNALPSAVEVDRKPFPFPVSETAFAAYGFGEGVGPPTSPVEVGRTSDQSPFAVASSLPWRRLPQSTCSWYFDGGLDHVDCKMRASLGHHLPPTVTGAISPRFAQSSYGHRTLDNASVTGGVVLSHSSNGSSQSVRNDSSLPTSLYPSNAGKSHHP